MSNSHDELTIGQRASRSLTITAAEVETFAHLVGDLNPVHMDDDFARRTRFGRRIAHGMLAGGLISAVLANDLPGPGTIYLSQQMKFLAPVYLGDTVTATVEVVAWRADKRIATLKTDCYNQDGQPLIAGEAVVLVERIE